MGKVRGILHGGAASSARGAGLVRRLGAWCRDPLAGRSRRVVLALAFIWLVGLIDLHLTLLAVRIGHFQEVNPVARALIHSPPLVVAYKLVLLMVCTGLMFRFRRRLLTEVGCWLLAGAHAVLAFLWHAYYAPLL